MKKLIQRAMVVGLHVVMAAGVGACDLPLGELACGDGWCPDAMVCIGPPPRCVTPNVCGNGIVDVGEACDDGNTASGDGCSAICQFEVCGNGIVDVGETCDDGNTVSGDGCSAICQLEICGNGIIDVGEQCDDGNQTNGDSCEVDCTLPRCGNGIQDRGEQCDDGMANGQDGRCTASCTLL